MYDDDEVTLLIEKHGYVKSISIMVYATMKLEDVEMISSGIVPFLMVNNVKSSFVTLVDYIDEDLANISGGYVGTKISIIFGGEIPHEEYLVKHIQEGLDFLRVKHELMGITRCDSGV